MPIEEAPRGQLDHEDVTEAAEDILPCNALDAIRGSAPTTAIILDIVRYRARDGIRAAVRRIDARREPQLIRPPVPRRALRL
jgi:hypothetical protein